MKRSIGLAVVVASVFALGCAQRVWQKPGSSQDEFSRDRYTCLQQSQQFGFGAVVNSLGGSAASGMRTNEGLFGSCMNSKGWYLQQQATTNSTSPVPSGWSFADVVKADTDAAKAACAEADFQAVLLPKTSCNSNDLTLAQLTDSSKMSEAQKGPFDRYRTLSSQRSERFAKSVRQNGGSRGAKVAALAEEAQARVDRASLSLYAGRTTWGEFNNERRETARFFRQEFAKIQSGS